MPDTNYNERNVVVALSLGDVELLDHLLAVEQQRAMRLDEFEHADFVGAIPVDPVAGPDGAPTDTDAIVALSPDEARHIAALLRREYPLDAAPDDQECQRFDALADRIIGAIPVGAA